MKELIKPELNNKKSSGIESIVSLFCEGNETCNCRGDNCYGNKSDLDDEEILF
jgi:hypothetical protein